MFTRLVTFFIQLEKIRLQLERERDFYIALLNVFLKFQFDTFKLNNIVEHTKRAFNSVMRIVYDRESSKTISLNFYTIGRQTIERILYAKGKELDLTRLSSVQLLKLVI